MRNEMTHAEWIAQTQSDKAALDSLVDFVRTPEWSVSMLEDIAAIVIEARGGVDVDYDADDERAWRPH